jgi:TRAP-type C4-dicarboxylate transport system permease small subunit
MRRIVDLLGERLTHVCLAVAAISLLGIVSINGVNVLARYLFRAPFPWAEELMLFLMILAVFAGAIAVTWRNLHVRIEAFVERASPGLRRAALLLGTAISIAAIVTVTVASCRMIVLLYDLEMRTDALRVPSWIPQSFIPIGLGLIALLTAVRLVIALTEQRDKGSADSP